MHETGSLRARRVTTRRPSGAHVRKLFEVRRKLTVAPKRIFVDERGVTRYYRGTIATRGRTRGSVRIASRGRSSATTGATAGAIADRARVVVALVNHSEVHGEDDDENERHKSTKGDGQPNGTAIERTGPGGILRSRVFRILACW